MSMFFYLDFVCVVLSAVVSFFVVVDFGLFVLFCFLNKRDYITYFPLLKMVRSFKDLLCV